MKKRVVCYLNPIAILAIIAIFAITLCNISYSKPRKTDTKLALKSFIEKSGKEPSQYIVDKFKSKDIIILSEFNRLKHEVDFVKSIIPNLYRNGIYTLAMEFGNKEDQNRMNKLLGAEYFNRELAIDILRNFTEYGIWGYKEYLEIFKAAWSVNQSLTPSSQKFNIILLSSSDGYGSGKMIQKNQSMAKIIEKEILSKDKKALVYITSMHSENSLSSIDLKGTKKNEILKNNCLANVLKEKYPNRIHSVLFHSPWAMVGKNDFALTGVIKPLDGEIDAAIDLAGKNPVAFDVYDSPIKDLSEKRSVYYEMNKDYTVKCVCDGYIYLKPYEDYEYVTWIPDFITDNYLKTVKLYYSKINPDLKIETIDFATDVCSAYGYSLFEMAKSLKTLNFVQFTDGAILKNIN
jgi:hypothetical protein